MIPIFILIHTFPSTLKSFVKSEIKVGCLLNCFADLALDAVSHFSEQQNRFRFS